MHNIYKILLLGLLILSFFLREIYIWLFDAQADWYRPYLLWGAIIVVSFLIRKEGHKH